MAKLTPEDIKEIKAFRAKFPEKIGVLVHPAEEGGFCAEIEDFLGAVTEAETLAELIEMVNDAVATILEVPRKYLPYMPTYLPPVKLAQELGVFPPPKKDQRLVLSTVA